MSTSGGPEPGTILAGKYCVERVLGVGGMGVVVAAKHLQLDQRVAIKYLLPAARGNPEVVERFAREARTAAKIRGEHVARVIDVSQFDDGTPFMVLEYLEGHDLDAELTRRGALAIEDAVRYMLETCEALAEAHAAKVVHRDLKPANLFLAVQPDKRSIVKVLDFGISRSVDPTAAALTATTAMMGTVFYMSPEQLTNPKGIDHRADIWSLGVILYELLTNERPFTADNVPSVIVAVLQNRPTPVRSRRADVPEGLAAVVDRCLTVNPDERFQNVAELAAALAPFGTEKDMESVEVASRVLGAKVSPSLVTTHAAVTPRSSASSPTELLPPEPKAPSAETPPAWGQSLAELGTAGTLVAPGAGATSGRGRWLALGAGGLALVVAGGLFASRTTRPDARGVAAETPVASSSPLAASLAVPPAASSPPASSSAPLAAPAETPAASVHAGLRPVPRASAAAASPASAKASAVAVAPVTPPAPASQAPPAPTTPKNPLQMGLK